MPIEKIKVFFKKAAIFLTKNKIMKKVYLGFGLAILSIAVLFFGLCFTFRGKIYPKTYIGGFNFGGQTKVQAKETLNRMIDGSKDKKLDYEYGGKEYQITLLDLKVDYDSFLEESVNNLYSIGRGGSIGKILLEKIKSVFTHNNTQAAFGLDENKLDEFIIGIGKDIDKPEKDASIAFRDGEPYVTPEEIGQQFPKPENKTIAKKTIGEFDFEKKTAFLVINLDPKITTPIAEKALAKTRELLDHKLIMKARGKTFTLENSDLEAIIEFSPIKNRDLAGKIDASFAPEEQENYSLVPDFSPKKIGEYLDKISPEINQESQDAKFKVSDGRVVAFGLAQTGYELEKDKATEQIINALNTNQESIDLPVKETKPAIGSANPAEVGIKELIGEGKSSWRGSPPNRIHNISLGASRISGTIVKPGEEFSTLKTIGHIGPTTGFLPELVIKNSTKVEPDYGGGLCQVSTTLFRAVVYSGLKVTARTPHSFRVSYYEPPVGMDATIFDPAPDFKFINDMDTPILIWAIAGNNSLVFQFYGTKDGRKVDISTPVVGNYVSAGEPIYTESSTMAAGEIRQVERALSGATASFNYKVTAADGTVLEKETFVSKYVPIPNSYLYGPGTTGIPGVEGASTPATPSPTPSPSPIPFKKGT